MEKILQIMKAPIAKIWHDLKAKAIAALEKYASVSTFAQVVGLDYLVRCLPSRPNHLRNIVIKKLKSATLIFFCIFLGNINVEAQNAYSFFVAITSRKHLWAF